ncbi:MAG: hypothetical protein Q7T40_07775 [Methylobacter sp.]|nr:hypothetical protein [Methylobacter sp.]
MNEEVAEKDNDAGASLSNVNNLPEGRGFRPARKFDEKGQTITIPRQQLDNDVEKRLCKSAKICRDNLEKIRALHVDLPKDGL